MTEQDTITLAEFAERPRLRRVPPCPNRSEALRRLLNARCGLYAECATILADGLTIAPEDMPALRTRVADELRHEACEDATGGAVSSSMDLLEWQAEEALEHAITYAEHRIYLLGCEMDMDAADVAYQARRDARQQTYGASGAGGAPEAPDERAGVNADGVFTFDGFTMDELF